MPFLWGAGPLARGPILRPVLLFAPEGDAI